MLLLDRQKCGKSFDFSEKICSEFPQIDEENSTKLWKIDRIMTILQKSIENEENFTKYEKSIENGKTPRSHDKSRSSKKIPLIMTNLLISNETETRRKQVFSLLVLDKGEFPNERKN